jgi:hypothetical protein
MMTTRNLVCISSIDEKTGLLQKRTEVEAGSLGGKRTGGPDVKCKVN